MSTAKDPRNLLDLLPGQPSQVPDGHFRDEAGRKDITKVMGWIAFLVLILLALPYVFKHSIISTMQVPSYVIAPFALITIALFFKDTLTALKFFTLIQTAYQPNAAAQITSEGGPVATTVEGSATAETVTPVSPTDTPPGTV